MELNQKTPLALDFKSATLYAVRVVLQTHDMAQLQLALAQRMHDAGSFFKDEPVVIDAGELDDVVDWTALVALLRSHDLHPIAAVAAGDNVDAALDAGLTNVELSAPVARPGSQPADDKDVPAVAAPPEGSAGTAADTSASQTKPKTGNGKPAASTGRQAGHSGQRAAEVAQASVPAVAPAALVINRQLRSGQRIYARDTDLIVIGMVSQGAEVIA
ncbi:MAG TPA: septum site-determining protein MinC, partial [Burkholderiaceae bacterium]|nr:septum site-determining protein MinC [Burkholderiaceae bacterium]